MSWAAKTISALGAGLLVLSLAGASVAREASSAPIISGPVLEVQQAGVICVALGPRPEQWIQVRLAGAEHLDRNRLMAAAFAKRVDCIVDARGLGVCRLAGEDLATVAASDSVKLVAASWR